MYKVLVVDDEAPIRRWLKYCIDSYDGFECVGCASNGEEGLEVFRRMLPQIVITDVAMPSMDGLEMLKSMCKESVDFRAVILSSHEDFNYVREALKIGIAEYILKTEITQESLRNALQVIAGQLNEEIYDRNDYAHKATYYLQSLALNDQQMADHKTLAAYDITIEDNAYVAIDILAGSTALEISAFLHALGCMHNVYSFLMQNNQTIIIGNLNRDCTLSHIQQVCENFMEDNRCYIGISSVHENCLNLGQAIREAQRRVNLYFYYPEKHLFIWEKLPECTLHNQTRFRVLYEKALLDQNFSEAFSIKNQVVEAIRCEKPADIDSIKKYCFSFVVSVVHFTEDDIEIMELELDRINNAIMRCTNVKQLVEIINEFFNDIEYTIHTRLDCSAPIQRAIQYMEEHYGERISLSDVASQVALSPEYFSRVFNKEMGIKYSVYLSNIRMKKAVHLLKTTDMKIYEIAERVGFASQNYFSTVFRKYFNQNPYDYQSKMIQDRKTDAQKL